MRQLNNSDGRMAEYCSKRCVRRGKEKIWQNVGSRRDSQIMNYVIDKYIRRLF
jgi:hypothetical protein